MRYISNEIERLLVKEKRMAFIAGPRQAGKTTLAQYLLKSAGSEQWYFSWDIPEHRKSIISHPSDFWKTAGLPSAGIVPRICLDEIHKQPRWKNFLKGFYDASGKKIEIIVTGSGRLDIYQRGGDSLFGRYSMYHLMPFTVRELITTGSQPVFSPADFFSMVFQNSSRPENAEALSSIQRYSGFPEPLYAADEMKYNRWRREHETMLLREDVRDLTHLRDLGSLESLASLLPDRIGSPLSLNGLAEDISVSHVSIKHWIELLRRIYYLFEIRPYTGSLPRSLRKSPKVYLFDYGAITDPGARFENIVALHLYKLCTAWTDMGYGTFTLHYLRDRDGRETDFLITEGKKPLALIEAKLSDMYVDPNLLYFSSRVKPKHTIQVVLNSEKKYPVQISGVLTTTGAGFLSCV